MIATPPPPAQPVADPRPADLRREYVAGGALNWYGPYVRSLPHVIDDVTRDFGDDLYERMLFDAQIAACVQVLKASVLESGAVLTTAVDDAGEDGFDLAQEILETIETMIDQLATPMDDVLWNLLDALPFGNKVGELVYDLQPIAGRQLLALTAVKVKPRRATAFVVDQYTNVIGLLGALPGQSSVMTQISLDPNDTPNLLPRSKFCVLTFRPKDNDPRGTSILRPAYDPWWLKQQVKPSYLKYLAQFASPSLVGYAAEGAQTELSLDALGNPDLTKPPVSAVQAMLAAMLAFQNGTAMAFPFGAKVEPIEASGDGAAFRHAIALFDQQMTKAILTQQLATEQGEHQARAAAQVHQDVLETIVRQAKNSVIRMIRHDILMPLVRYNWGEDAVALTPNVGLGESEEHEFAPTVTAIAALMTSGYIDPSQYAELDSFLGLPARDPASISDATDRLNAPPPAPVVADPNATDGAAPKPAEQAA